MHYRGARFASARWQTRLHTDMYRLELNGISKQYPAVRANDRVSLRVEPGPLAVRARHAITFRRIRLEGYVARLRRPVSADPERYRWVNLSEASALPTSSMTRKLLRGLQGKQMPLEMESR